MNDVDGALVIRIALLVAGEVPEIAAGGEHRRDPRDGCDGFGVLEALECLDHHDDDEIVVDRLAVAAGNAAPHRGIEGRPAALAARSHRREVRPLHASPRLLLGVHCRNDEHERATVERVLDLLLVLIGDRTPGTAFACGQVCHARTTASQRTVRAASRSR